MTMWPWEHLAFGYLVYSLLRRIARAGPPEAAEAGCLFVATQLPDLVDKPLGWGTALIPSGHSLAHSLPVAVSTSLAAYLLGRRYDRGDVGAAFALAYLSHLPGDALYPVVLGDSPTVAFLLWPFVDLPPQRPDALAGHVIDLAVAFLAFLRTPRGLAFLLAEAAFLLATTWLWRRDGWPGLGLVRRLLAPRSG